MSPQKQPLPQILMPLQDALESLLEQANLTLKTEQLELQQATGRVLAEDLFSSIDVPPQDNSAVDGFAISSHQCDLSEPIPVSQRIQAGNVPVPLTPGTAARIFTGAEVPEGADSVVMQEDCEIGDSHVLVNTSASIGQNIRRAGQDVKTGEKILNKGETLTAPRLGLIASIGTKSILVYKPLTVAILSTGDELAEPGTQAKPGQIYNSNRYTLMSLLSQLGIKTIDYGRVPDKEEATIQALQNASSEADAVITTGGASVGDADYIQSAIKANGTLTFWRLAIKPGKPFMYGNIGNTPVLGLPGNPSAVLVTFMILVRPFLLKMQGCQKFRNLSSFRKINFDVPKPGKRREFLRVAINQENSLDLFPNQSSGMLSSASWASGLAEVEEGTTPMKGEQVTYYSFSELLSMPH